MKSYISKKQIFGNGIIPILFGGLIYVFWRPSSLVMFSWFEFLRIHKAIDVLRGNLNFVMDVLPDWVLFSLPNAIWVYSLTYMMLLIWYKEKSKAKYLFIALGPVLGIGIEFAQLFGIIPGVFCFVDLILCIFATVMSFFVFVFLGNTKKVEVKLKGTL